MSTWEDVIWFPELDFKLSFNLAIFRGWNLHGCMHTFRPEATEFRKELVYFSPVSVQHFGNQCQTGRSRIDLI